MSEQSTGRRSGKGAGGRAARAIERAASQWLARQSLGSLDEEELARLEDWLSENLAHRATFDRMAGALASVDGAGPVAREVDRRARTQAANRSVRTASLSLGVACLAIITLFSTTDPVAEFADVHTARGEQRSVTLADGSQLLLDADAAVNIDYDRNQRTIKLVRGRIHADVRHGDPRPFRVAALDGEVRDVGTSFDVSFERDRIETIVTGGIVMARSAGIQLRLVAGEGASWRAGEAPRPVALTQDMRSASWRYGRLVFDRRPLAEVVTTLSRYSKRPLWLWNHNAGQRPVSGVVRASAVDGSLASLARAQGLKVRDLGFAIILY